MASNNLHTESTFEAAITGHLLGHGWHSAASSDFSRELAFDKKAVLDFVRTTQPAEWQKLEFYYKSETENKFTQRLFKELDLRGMLDVLRHGITDSGVKFRLAFFRPDSGLNPETLALYQQNRLGVARQVFYSKDNRNSLDLLLSLNGLPVATVELKNHFTGQAVGEAMEQYKTSRSPSELLFQFKKRALVHFTVDPDNVYLTTRLDGLNTKFLPFNRGNKGGAGNPANQYSYKTAYFWEETLAVDSWLDLLGRFLHLQKDKYTVDGKEYTKETMIFPRYHQIDTVRRLAAHTREHGTGLRYLIQHSAGSGKSNSIGWLAHRLSALYDADDRKIFDSVIVVTDRNVLDQQLQNTIYQFEHKSGVVQRIDENSEQLADAIKNATSIIITTLQKFPFALRHLGDVPDRKYAVIIDEAHSSQGGTASRKMTEALASANQTLEEAEQTERDDPNAEDEEDYIRESIRKQGPQPNLNFYAFTATPKPKTLEVFGTPDAEGKPKPFHLYSMRQAIEEGFILDVLKNYHTYKEYFAFSKAIEDDPELNKRKAVKAIGRFASLLPYSLAQKTEVIVEHFRQVTMKKIGGKAKAMVVTASRKHALRYYLEFKDYIGEKGYQNIRPLVAFSGKVIDDLYPDGVTEPELNGFGEKELPGKFDTPEYQVLLVADKYQTGFDQPLLHSMFVDKKLSGVKAVQTLSRLNRTCPGKEDTFVLDFANDREDIIASFQPYYELTTLTETTDPNHLYDLKNQMDATQVFYQSEVDAFAKIFYKPGQVSLKDQGRLYAWIDPAVDRFKALNETPQDDFKNAATAFVRMYSFLTQILPFQDVELEKLFTFLRYLLTKLPKSDYTERLRLDNEVALEYYRLQKIAEGDLVLQVQGEHGLDPAGEAGIRRPKEEVAKLSDIIRQLNDRFGTDFNETDRFNFEQLEEELSKDEMLKLRAQNNSLENFKYAFEDVFIDKVLDRQDASQEFFGKILENPEFKQIVGEFLMKKIYQKFKEE